MASLFFVENMKIDKIIIKNFQLFKEAEFMLDKINLITGVNLDNPASSGNGSGKTTILNALFFCLYGNVAGLNLVDLIKIGEKGCSVEVQCSKNNEHYRIIRKIPSELHIFLNDKELEANTLPLKQKYIDEQFGNYNFFRTYRTIDNNKGINLLDEGIVSLRKALMAFIDTYFTEIRQNLLTKKLDRERFNVNKRLYSFYLSQKKLTICDNGIIKLQKELNAAKIECNDQYKIISNYKSEIDSRKKIIYFKEQDKKKLNGGMCPILNTKCPQISGQLEKVDIIKNKEITLINQEIGEIVNLVKSEESCMEYYNNVYESIQQHVQKTKEYAMKLREAFKFVAYKYTAKDVQLYTEAIKVLDSFSGYYINQWLDNLSIIINDLLKPVNISIEFTPDKGFLKVTDAGQVFKYEQLSSGQKVFLNAIFKIGLLLNNGQTCGILIIDEGINTLDSINLQNFLEIIKTLNFQVCLIYQNITKEMQDVNYISVERKDNNSIIK